MYLAVVPRTQCLISRSPVIDRSSTPIVGRIPIRQGPALSTEYLKTFSNPDYYLAFESHVLNRML